MREILFRGKLIANGEWAYGCLKINPDKSTAIITPDDTPLGKYGIVDPDTVGQNSGLTDKNGVKIFEGDILGGMSQNGTEFKAVCAFRDGCLGVHWRCENIESFAAFFNFCNATWEVIGNIHDDPNPMKEEAEHG